ncbi:MAG: hypothetical protein MJZ20_02885 [Bacteroidaceae bacterium]|nr:hypothetical protein [Bacteroidaceae bacterium]
MDTFFRDYDKQRAYNSLVYVAKWLDVLEHSLSHGQYQRAKRILNYALDSILDMNEVNFENPKDYKEVWAIAKRDGKKKAKVLKF